MTSDRDKPVVVVQAKKTNNHDNFQIDEHNLDMLLATEPRKRVAVHVDRETWEHLRRIGQVTGLSLASVVKFMALERSPEIVNEAVKTSNFLKPRQGRRKQAFF